MQKRFFHLNSLNIFISFARVFIGINLLLLAPSILNSEELVYHQFEAAEHDREFESVLYLAAGVALVEAGISSTKEGKDYDFILLTTYSKDASEGERVEVEYTFYPSSTSDEEVSAKDPVKLSTELQIEHNIDIQVAVVIKRLLQKAEIQTDPSREAQIYGLLSDSPRASQDSEDSGVSEASGEPQESKGVSEGSDRGEDLQKEKERQEKGDPQGITNISEMPRKVKFDSTVSIAGLLMFGRATQFFHYGAGSILRAGAAWSYKTWSFTLGAKSAVFRVFNDIGVVGGPLYLSTAGANLQFKTHDTQPHHAAAGVSGGAAIITVDAPEQMLSKTVPYVDFTAHSGIALGEHFSVGGEIGFLMIFDDDFLIMGATPALIFQVEL